VYGTRAIKEFNVALGRYVIMPDHLHFFVRGDQNFVLGNWVKGLKRAILKAFPNEKGYSLWEPGFFDHLLRNDESYAQNGNTFAKIQFARAWCTARKIGLIRARSSISTARSM
jgi:REP element-mobilizing transposase RayT